MVALLLIVLATVVVFAFFWKNKNDCSLFSFSINHIDLKVNDCVQGDCYLTGFYGCPERTRRRES